MKKKKYIDKFTIALKKLNTNDVLTFNRKNYE